jgi:hypothetical protein
MQAERSCKRCVPLAPQKAFGVVPQMLPTLARQRDTMLARMYKTYHGPSPGSQLPIYTLHNTVSTGMVVFHNRAFPSEFSRSGFQMPVSCIANMPYPCLPSIATSTRGCCVVPTSRRCIGTQPKSDASYSGKPKSNTNYSDKLKSNTSYSDEPKSNTSYSDEPKSNTSYSDKPKSNTSYSDKP